VQGTEGRAETPFFLNQLALGKKKAQVFAWAKKTNLTIL
jgi:hypothetical protein